MPLLEQEVRDDLKLILNEQLSELDKSGNQKAHFVNPPSNTHIWKPGMDMRVLVEIAMAKGLELTALCGYKWVPSKDPDKFPACEKCAEIAIELMAGAGE